MSATLRVYTPQGRERWMRPGQVVPAGWYDGKGTPLTTERVVASVVVDGGNPYEQFSIAKRELVLVERSVQ